MSVVNVYVFLAKFLLVHLFWGQKVKVRAWSNKCSDEYRAWCCVL